MKQFAIFVPLILVSMTALALPKYSHFKGKVRGISVSSGGFANMTTATIEVTLDVGVTRKDNYSICQDISEREYSALIALLIDSRSRNQESSFSARPVTGVTDFFCITSITSP